MAMHCAAGKQVSGSCPPCRWHPCTFFYRFVGFTFVCAYMLLNLYVGVIFSQFSRIRNLSETGSAFLTHEQTEWVELSRMVFKLKPPDKSSLPVGRRLWWYRVVHSKVRPLHTIPYHLRLRGGAAVRVGMLL